jgi:nanoRNase/pAp phosphatase (c-di-AMP/oligoRNAs hydrolase)
MGKHVTVVDFSFPRATLLEMDAVAASMLVLDHHKTAQKDLEGLPFCKFDISRSGARIAWEHWFGAENVPALIRYIEDRDLWKFALPWSREVSAYISTLPRTFEALNELHLRLECEGVRVVGELGSIALRVTEQYVQTQVTRAKKTRISGHDVPCVNTTFAISELVGELAKTAPFAAGWFQRDDGKFVYSLRSSGESNVDVSAIAKSYGGGGHARAAGFTVDTLL